jgi:hypothetical protein
LNAKGRAEDLEVAAFVLIDLKKFEKTMRLFSMQPLGCAECTIPSLVEALRRVCE